VNGLVSVSGFNSPEWLGWLGKDMDATIDLGSSQAVSKVTVNVWKQEPSYIYLPQAVEVSTSADGQTWSIPARVEPRNGQWENQRKISVQLKENTSARYVKIVARNLNNIPAGKPGAGKTAWLFADEIEVE
jgi:hexosaminidase